MRRQAQADTAMIMTMMYEALVSLVVNSVGGASPATQPIMHPRHPIMLLMHSLTVTPY